MLLFAVLLAVPLTEIALFVVVGDRIGLMATLGVVLATAVIGAAALRGQGFAVLQRAQTLSRPEDLSDVLLDGLFLFAAGLLLLTPGFLTDSVGFLLLIPPVRRFLARQLGRRMAVNFMHMETHAQPEPEPARRPEPESPPESPADGRSPWAARRAAAPKRGEADEAVVIENRDSNAGGDGD